MKLSDRDTKIIVVLLIIAVLALPYVLVVRPVDAKIDGVIAEVATLTERLTYLQSLNVQRDFYLEETTRYNRERDVMIQSYAGGIRQENTIMFLSNTEHLIPLHMTALSFGENVETPISADTVDENNNVIEGLTALKTETSVGYTGEYESLKELLDYIMKYDERMVIPSMDITLDPNTGKYNGMFVLAQFAITGEGRELEPAVIPAYEHGNENIFTTVTTEEGEESANYGGDFYLALRANSAEGAKKLFGQSGIMEAQLSNSSNSKQSVSIKLTGEGGSYSAEYALGTAKYTVESFSCEDDVIDFNIYSTVRDDSSDKVAANIKIINETDLSVKVIISGDDAENPRVVIAQQEGDVTVE